MGGSSSNITSLKKTSSEYHIDPVTSSEETWAIDAMCRVYLREHS